VELKLKQQGLRQVQVLAIERWVLELGLQHCLLLEQALEQLQFVSVVKQ